MPCFFIYKTNITQFIPMDLIFIDMDQIVVSTNKDGTFNLLYNDHKLTFDLPIMRLPWNVKRQYGKYYTDLSFYQLQRIRDGYASDLFCVLYQLENYIMTRMPIDCQFIRSLKGDPKHMYPPRLRVRVSPDDINSLDEGSYISGRITCEKVWWSKANNLIGCSWWLSDIFVLENPE